MRNQWIHCLVGVLSVGAVACQNTETKTETVTQSAKAAPAKATAAPEKAKSAAVVAAKAAAGTEATTPSATTPSSAATELKVGDAAPAIKLTLQDGKTVALASLKGKSVALYFYPKDDTPGCTVEAKGIRDEWAAFEKAGIQVFGVSMQDASSHQAFIAKYKLPFSLVVDSDGAVTKAFGVAVSGGQYASRNTVLIGADGNVKQIWRQVDPAKHAKELLAAVGS